MEEPDSIRVDIDCTRFPGNNKAGDTLEERERECACVRDPRRRARGQRDRNREGGLSLFGSEAKYSERADRVRVTVN